LPVDPGAALQPNAASAPPRIMVRVIVPNRFIVIIEVAPSRRRFRVGGTRRVPWCSPRSTIKMGPSSTFAAEAI